MELIQLKISEILSGGIKEGNQMRDQTEILSKAGDSVYYYYHGSLGKADYDDIIAIKEKIQIRMDDNFDSFYA